MQSFIRKVTITGVDEFTSTKGLIDLTAKYPFVEWGFLVSDKRAGKDNRYPTLEYIRDTIVLCQTTGKCKFSCHVCGFWARDVTEGGLGFLDEHRNIVELCDRLQLNISHVVDDLPHPRQPFYDAVLALGRAGPRVIIQVKDRIGPDLEPLVGTCDFLFDGSGGRGVLASSWPRAAYTTGNQDHKTLVSCGYAGGLNPDNLEAQIAAMAASAEGRPVWIDVESGVRTSEVLDLDKVDRFLAAANPYVTDDHRQNP